MLDELLQTLKEKRCRHFWISDNDLYEGIKKSSLESLHKMVLKIRENPAPYIKKIGSLSSYLCPQKILTSIWKLLYTSYYGATAEDEEVVKEPPEEIICIK